MATNMTVFFGDYYTLMAQVGAYVASYNFSSNLVAFFFGTMGVKLNENTF